MVREIGEGGSADGVKWRETDKEERRVGLAGRLLGSARLPRRRSSLLCPRNPLAPPLGRRRNKIATLDFRARAEPALSDGKPLALPLRPPNDGRRRRFHLVKPLKMELNWICARVCVWVRVSGFNRRL